MAGSVFPAGTQSLLTAEQTLNMNLAAVIGQQQQMKMQRSLEVVAWCCIFIMVL